MTPQFTGDISAFEQTIVQNIERHGCHINWVWEEGSTEPPFAYSIGFTKTIGSPEVVLFGLPRETTAPAINALLAMAAGGLRLVEGERISKFFGEFDAVVRMVDESWLIQSYFASALWYHRTQTGEALKSIAMIVWPDADHRLPWEDGCADWVRRDQPALYEPRGHR